MIQEFKDFINRGSVVELAVAVVMGAAFAPVVASVVDRLMMPLIALVIDQPNFDSIGQFGENGSVGAVITALVNFLLVALAVFLVVKLYNKMQQPEERTEDEPAEDIVILKEIRDELAKANGVTVSSPQRADT